MIQELTIENLIKLGLSQEDANTLFNADEYNLQCNAGNFYTLKAENIFYTGFQYWKFVYLTKNLSFPFNAPELAPEYFSKVLELFLQSKKDKLKALYNEENETQIFLTKEIDWSKETILYWENKKLTTKENLIDVLKGYLYFLENYKIPSGKNKAEKIVELKDFFYHTTPLQLEEIKKTFASYKGKDLAIVIYFLIQKNKLNITKNSQALGLNPFLKQFAKMEKNEAEAVRKNFQMTFTSNFQLIDINNLELTGIEEKIENIYKVG